MSIAELAVRIVIVTFVWTAQSTRPAFEVASIRPSANAQRQAVAAAGQTDSAQFRIGGLTIKDYISMAYAVKLNQISGPDWITTDRFDIAATLPDGARQDQVPSMMQALLEDRFELKTHREKNDFPVYALRVASGGFEDDRSPTGSRRRSVRRKSSADIHTTGLRSGYFPGSWARLFIQLRQ
jgi:uncharacterized protein (TIGR03435 family)